ncbi:MAG: hypothetical protein K8F30_04540 [Taibaiella sp.]|nr:hypothetical protein [Taibaiella sp.]
MKQQSKLYDIIEKYKAVGMFKGSEFLFSPEVALQLVGELVNTDIVISRVTVWRHVDLPNGSIGIAQDLILDFSVPIEIIEAEDAIKKSAELTRDFLNNLPKEVKLVSLDLYSFVSWMKNHPLIKDKKE